MPILEAQKDHTSLEAALADGGIEVEETEPSEKVSWLVADGGGWFVLILPWATRELIDDLPKKAEVCLNWP